MKLDFPGTARSFFQLMINQTKFVLAYHCHIFQSFTRQRRVGLYAQETQDRLKDVKLMNLKNVQEHLRNFRPDNDMYSSLYWSTSDVEAQ